MDRALPGDVIVRVALDWLSPREQRGLAGTCARCRELLPPPLRIRIGQHGAAGHDEDNHLSGDLFVTPVLDDDDEEEEEEVPSHDDDESGIPAPVAPRPYGLRGRPLDTRERLLCGRPYAIWRFDDREHRPVYLGRHLRQTCRSPAEHHFTLGFEQAAALQAWTFLVPEGGKTVPWNDPTVSLRVKGRNPRPGQPDSNEEHVLVSRRRARHDGGPSWSWFTREPAANTNTNNHHNTIADDNDNDNHHTAINADGVSTRFVPRTRQVRVAWTSDRLFVRRSSEPTKKPFRRTTVFPVETQAIPEITDKGAYSLFRPDRWQPHLSPCSFCHHPKQQQPSALAGGRFTVIEFSFWAEAATLYFRAFHLPFSLAVPIMDLDKTYFSPNLGPIANLFASYSARWGCIKYYMATAADVGEGHPLDMPRFLEGVTDHEEHSVEHDESRELVSILMTTTSHPCNDDNDENDEQESNHTQQPPPPPHNHHNSSSTHGAAPIVATIPRDDSRVWRFFFSW